MDFKFLISIFAVGLTFVGYFSYFKDILAKKSKPHSYTWLIWALTQGTAAVALIYGGGKFGSLVLVEGTVLVSAVFFVSLIFRTYAFGEMRNGYLRKAHRAPMRN